MTIEEAIKILGRGSWWDYLDDEISDADFGPLDEALDKAIAALRAQQEAEKNGPMTPCDLCAYNPPSSLDGKPCCLCPAVAKCKQKEGTK